MSGLKRKCSELSLVSCSDAEVCSTAASSKDDDQVLSIDDMPLAPLAKKVNAVRKQGDPAKFRHTVICRNATVRFCDSLSKHPERALQVWSHGTIAT